MNKPKVIVILGPTTSGKSDLAVKLALKFRGEIISADSRQVYKGLDIGSGKIKDEEKQGVPHYLLDVLEPQKTFTVSQYKRLGEKKLKDITDRLKLPIIVGGTGFYIDALTGTIDFPEVKPNKKLREELEQKSVEELFKMLEAKDPLRAKTIDKHNKPRLIRALEIIEAIGKVPPLSNVQPGRLNIYEFIFIGLNLDKEKLEEKIYKRLINRLPEILKECEKLQENGLSWKRMFELGLEYRYASLYLKGKMTKEEMEKKLFIEIKKYAKRQMTWFKRNKKIKWFKPEELKDIENYLEALL